MQKSITSFFGAPKEGAGAAPPSPPKPRPAASKKPAPKTKAKAKAKPNAKKDAAAAAATVSPSKDQKKGGRDGGDEDDSGTSSPSPSPAASPAKNGTAAAGKDDQAGKKKAAGKRKAGDEHEEEGEGDAGSGGKAAAPPAGQGSGDKGGGGGGGEEEESEDEAPVQPAKKLRGLAKKAVVEDSDDEMFGAGAAAGDDDDDGGEGGGDEGAKATALGTKGEEKGASKAKKAAAKSRSRLTKRLLQAKPDKMDEEDDEPDTAGEEGLEDMDADDEDHEEDGGDEEEEDEEDEDDESEVEEVDGPGSKGGKTVASALMSGANRAKSAPPPKKKVKGSTAANLVMAKMEDLLAKASWKKGEPVPFKAVAEVFERVEKTTKRLEIQEILRGFLCTVIALTPEDLPPCVYLACNQLAPAYEGVELGIGDSLLMKALQGASGRTMQQIKKEAQEEGDLGLVAQTATKAQRTLSFGQKIPPLSARDILERYRKIAAAKGTASSEDKANRIKKMLVACKDLQAKYIIRGLQGKMRIGLTATTVMVSLAHAAVTCPSEAAAAAEKAEKALAEQEKEEKRPDEDAVKADGAGDKQKEKKAEGGGDGDGDGDGGGEGEGEGDATNRKQGAEKGQAGGGGAVEQDGEVDGLIPVAVELRDTPATPRHLEQRLDLAVQLVKQAYSECPNLDLLIKAILEAPLYRLQQTCRLTPGVPVSPMLAKPTKSIAEVMQRLSGQEFTCEYKYDGVRAQVHLKPDGSLRFFSRNSKDSSSELPDLIPVMKDCVTEGVSSYVIDTEVVAYDRDTGNLLPFQMLSTRGRKDVDAKDVKVKVIVEAFDMLYLNEKSLLQMPLLERRKMLRDTFKEVEGRFRFATFMDHKEDGDTGPIEEFLAEAVKGNCEGLMVKTLTTNSTYEPSKRSLNWLKLKKDYLQADGGGVGDSLDLVPIGAFFGKGKRTGKYGAYLLACYEPDREEYQSVCKIGTGFTDEILLSFWEDLKEHTVENRPRYYNVADTLSPDVWLEPCKVWEVKCADLSKSPVHKAAIGKIAKEPDRGISIRFPRLLRDRPDKSSEQATTSDQILDMYESQDVVKSNATGAQANNADDDWEL